jgi:hypothetical protein
MTDEVKSKAEWQGAEVVQAQGFDKWKLKHQQPVEHHNIQPIKEPQ